MGREHIDIQFSLSYRGDELMIGKGLRSVTHPRQKDNQGLVIRRALLER